MARPAARGGGRGARRRGPAPAGPARPADLRHVADDHRRLHLRAGRRPGVRRLDRRDRPDRRRRGDLRPVAAARRRQPLRPSADAARGPPPVRARRHAGDGRLPGGRRVSRLDPRPGARGRPSSSPDTSSPTSPTGRSTQTCSRSAWRVAHRACRRPGAGLGPCSPSPAAAHCSPSPPSSPSRSSHFCSPPASPSSSPCSYAGAMPSGSPRPKGRRPPLGRIFTHVAELLRHQPSLRAYLLANALWELSLGATKAFVVLYVTAGLGYSIGSASAADRRLSPSLVLRRRPAQRPARRPPRARCASPQVSLLGLRDARSWSPGSFTAAGCRSSPRSPSSPSAAAP